MYKEDTWAQRAESCGRKSIAKAWLAQDFHLQKTVLFKVGFFPVSGSQI